MRKKKGRIKNVLYALIVGFAIISFWRGIWGLSDLYLFPSNPTLSFGISALIGVFILLFTKHLIKELL